MGFILTGFDWFALVVILMVTFAGGYMPLFKGKISEEKSFPGAESFTAGIFLALSLAIMLPAGMDLTHRVIPFEVPLAPVFALLTFLILLSIEHAIQHLKMKVDNTSELSSPVIPTIMTIMIALPSFFMGAALGVSGKSMAILVFCAIVLHKGSAGFALALKMVRSSMSRGKILAMFCLFAFSTPTGIILGYHIHEYMAGEAIIVIKGIIFSMASGTFLYMATLHDLKRTALIQHCNCKKNFVLLFLGVLITVAVRFLLGVAHHG